MRILVGMVAMVGCYAPNPTAGALCSEDGFCPAGQMCYSGRCYESPPIDDSQDDAPLDAAVDACGDNLCQGGNLVGCGVTTTCSYGCVNATLPHCARITPSNALMWSLVASPGGALTLAAGAHVLDTTSGILTSNGATVTLPSAVTTQVVGSMMVLALGSLSLETGATLTVRGSRALAILADGDVTVKVGAMILLGAGCPGAAFDPTCGGPGGGIGARLNAQPATGCGGAKNGYLNQITGTSEVGGGGGGYGRAGADSVSTVVGDGGHGVACGAANLEPLIGGSGGGAGGIEPGADVRSGGRGGGGGGAIQITAAGTLLVSGVIDAAGAGGENGYPNGVDGSNGGGGGGGSGGGILLEAGTLTVPGTVTANGGGAGGNHTTIMAGHGETGRRDRTCATGGAATGNASPGGRGDCDMQGPGSGGNIGDRGGGGGGVGRIRFNGRTNQLGGATISGQATNGQPPLE